MRTVAVVFCLLLLNGCGQKGALVLPDRQPKALVAVPAGAEPGVRPPR
jgi:predicted small lipoprotein YifL